MPVPKILTTSCVEILVDASLDGGFNQGGQCVLNVFHFSVSPVTPPGPVVDTTMLQWLQAFQLFWRDQILPNVSASYVVNRYFGRELSGTRLVKATDPNSKTTWEVRQWYELIGSDTADRGALDGAWLPNYAALSIYRNVLLLGGRGRSQTRICGLMEDQTEATNGNKLTTAAKAAFTPAANILIQAFPSDAVPGEIMSPVLLQKFKAFQAPVPQDDLTPYMHPFNYSKVQEFVTSQVTRKRPQRGCC